MRRLVEFAICLTLACCFAGCLQERVEIDATVTWAMETDDLCFGEPLDTLVIDIFDYIGPSERPSLTASACSRCGNGSGDADCIHRSRVCRCGPMTSMADLATVFRGPLFSDLDAGTVCVRVMGLATGTSTSGDCTESLACPDRAIPEGPLCLLSQLGVIGEDTMSIQIDQTACPALDSIITNCRESECDCTIAGLVSCAETGVGCRPECGAEIRMGCFAGSRSCQLGATGLVTTAQCASVGL